MTGHGGLAAVVPGAYVVATLATTAVEVARDKDAAVLLLPAVFPTMHLAWGLGFLVPGQPSSSDA